MRSSLLLGVLVALLNPAMGQAQLREMRQTIFGMD